MKLRSAILIIALIIIIDQVSKIWIKTSFEIGPVEKIFGSGSGESFRGFQLYFVENPGMAWGAKWGGIWGKAFLTLFRLAAVIFGSWYLAKIVREKYRPGFIVCASLIYAGALGNLIDSMFYGLIFDKGLLYNAQTGEYDHYYDGIAQFSSDGYSNFLLGNVVDMLHFPLFSSTFPSWLPVVGGESFTFFSPIFNIADASISVGVIVLLLFQKRLMHRDEPAVAEAASGDQAAERRED